MGQQRANLLSLDDALARIVETLEPLGSERVELSEALGRALVEDLHADRALPPFDNSAMDGFALRASDIAEACEAQPVELTVADHIAAGMDSNQTLQPRRCARIFTGAPVPPGADAIVPQENVVADQERARFAAPARVGAHIRRRGEDIEKGTLVGTTGDTVDAARIAVLASQGVTAVALHARPTIAILSTGSELVDIGQALGPGQIPDSNRYMLQAQARAASIGIQTCRRVDDDPAMLRDALDEAAASARLVVTSGGVSVGDHDHVRMLLEREGRVVFWRVAIKPGKPLLFGFWKDVPVLGLPGNPVASFVGFELFVRSAWRRLAGHAHAEPPWRHAALASAVRCDNKRVQVLRARLAHDANARLHATPMEKQGSHQLCSITGADGLVLIPAGDENLAEGDVVRCLALA